MNADMHICEVGQSLVFIFHLPPCLRQELLFHFAYTGQAGLPASEDSCVSASCVSVGVLGLHAALSDYVGSGDPNLGPAELFPNLLYVRLR